MERQNKVLLVDDDEFALWGMAKVLGGEGYQVVTAASGSEALELLKQDSFDLVLTDLKMPGVDGLEVLRQAKEIAPQAIVLILTGYASLESAIEALREGAYDYLVKPCSGDELKLKIERGLERVRLAEERQRAEKALQESEERFKNIFEHSPIGIYQTTPNGCILVANPTLVHMLGYSSLEELAQRNLESEGYHPNHIRSDFKRRIESEGEIIGLDSAWLRKDGSTLFVRENARAVRDESGNTLYYEGTVEDITERKRAEEELRRSYLELRRALEATVNTLVSAIEMKAPYTAGHQRQVTRLACAIAREMGLPQEQIEGLRMAGLIHDLGKMSIPAEILSKPTQLSELEWGMIKAHPKVGYDILKEIDFPWPVAKIVLQHHERLDGSGYPQGLSGTGILMKARILAVADVVEAMASHRPYRPARGLDKALEEISQNKGVLCDPEVVDVCLKLFAEKGFTFE